MEPHEGFHFFGGATFSAITFCKLQKSQQVTSFDFLLKKNYYHIPQRMLYLTLFLISKYMSNINKHIAYETVKY